MGILRQAGSEHRVTLYARHKVGRMADNQLVIQKRVVSGNHAMLVWQGDAWYVRDLGSTNGTSVNDVQLPAGESRRLIAGNELTFGQTTERWLLESDGPPRAAAVDVVSGKAMEASGELLILPSEEDPQVSIFPDSQGTWVCEAAWATDASLRPVQDLERIELNGRVYQLHLPDSVEGTISHKPVAPTLETIELVIRHTGDEETVAVQVQWPTGSADLKIMNHHQLLLPLARRALEAKADDNVDPWMYVDELLHELGSDFQAATLNVWIFRCRKALNAIGVDGAAGLIERRPQTRQLRLVVGGLRVEMMSV